MKNKTIWTNYKIYAFILGIVTGTIVYNALSIDFSFSMIRQIKVNDFKRTFFYLLMINLRFWILVFVISFFKAKNKIILLIIFVQSFVMAGMISLSILSKSAILMYGVPMTIIKIIVAIFMFDDKKPVLNKVFSVIILMGGTLVENFFITNF